MLEGWKGWKEGWRFRWWEWRRRASRGWGDIYLWFCYHEEEISLWYNLKGDFYPLEILRKNLHHRELVRERERVVSRNQGEEGIQLLNSMANFFMLKNLSPSPSLEDPMTFSIKNSSGQQKNLPDKPRESERNREKKWLDRHLRIEK